MVINMSFPQVDDVVSISLKSNGNGKLVKTKSTSEMLVTDVYGSRNVKVASGDVWQVVPDGHGKWKAVG